MTAPRNATNFDDFSGNYREVLDGSLTISGESSEYFAAYKADYLARLAGTGFRGRILDYGCGVGLLSRLLKQRLPQARVDGYDVSAQSVGQIPAELATQGKFTSNLGELKPGYALAVISNVMHHIPPAQRQQTINSIAGLLAPGGRLVVFEHNPWNPATRWVVSHCPFDGDAVLLRPAETRRYFVNAGLRPNTRQYIVFFPRVLSFLRRLEPSLGWLPAGAQYALTGEKRG